MSSAIESGTQLGPYEIKKQLSAGGMGEVWLAKDARLGREVAIKVLPPQFATDPERRARFEQEARAAAGLNHPHIAVVHDIGEQDGTFYMVQERLEGQTLRDTVDTALPLPRALQLGVEIAEALSAAHKAGIVHRDLKPENIFVTEDGHAKVLDFGLAKLTEMGGAGGTEASMSPTLLGTQAGEVMGTAGYMAPEQAQGEEVDHRADLFALGCVLYEMTTGKRPFEGENVYETLGKIVSKEPEPLESRLPGAPTELQRIVRKCLSKDKAMRYQTAADVAIDLRVLQSEAEAGRAELSAVVDPARNLAPSAGVSPVLVAGIVVLAAAGAFYASRALQPGPAETPMKTFEIDFPAEFPNLTPCCSTSLVVSRDDTFLALFSSGGGFLATGLSIRRQDSTEFVRVGDFAGYNPDISPDGEWVVYNRFPATRGAGSGEIRLQKVALAGGAPFDLGVTGIAPPSWGDDGYIYLGGADTPRRVPENGGDVEVLELEGLEDVSGVAHVFAIPGGRLLLLGLATGGRRGAGIAVMDLQSSSVTVLVEEGSDPRWAPPGHLLWTRAGAVYAAAFDTDAVALTGRSVPVLQGVAGGIFGESHYSLSDAGTLVWVPGSSSTAGGSPLRLVWLDREGNATPISTREERFGSARVAFDGSRVAVNIREGDEDDVWVLDVSQGALARLTSDGASSEPLWSRDDAWIYFTAGDAESGDIWRRRADFSAPAEPVFERPLRQVGGDVSPDGKFLVFEEWTQVEDSNRLRGDLWLLPLDGGDPVPLVESPDSEYDPRFSVDGNLVAYVSSESGVAQVYVREIDGGRRALVSPGEARSSSPAWSRDGRHLYYRSAEGLFEAQVGASAEGLRIAPPTLLAAADMTLRAPLDVSVDGRFLARQRIVSGDGESGPGAPDRIIVTLNWFQELRRLAPRDQ